MRFILLLTLLFISPLSLALTAGDNAAAFRLPQLNGDRDVSLAQYRGKIVYLDFWASWCGPCRKSLPALDSIYHEFNNAGFEILAISLDDDIRAGQTFAQDYPVSYTLLHDATGTSADSYALPGMPTGYLIDRSGKIVLVHVGYKAADEQALRASIRRLLQMP